MLIKIIPAHRGRFNPEPEDICYEVNYLANDLMKRGTLWPGIYPLIRFTIFQKSKLADNFDI